MATIKGTTGNDTLVGTTDADTINISQGGEDAVTALDGDDSFTLKGTFDAGDSLDGGVGNDKICLNGDYSAGVTLNANTITSIETIQLTAGNNYSLTMNDGNVASGARLTIDASRLGAANQFTFNGSAEADGHFTLIGGVGNDVLKGGQAGDTINLTKGGEDSFTGGAGNDAITIDDTLDAGDHIDGGAGTNSLHLHGDYSAGLTLGATTIQNIQSILFDNQNYNITVNAANFASTAIVTIDGSALSGPQSLRFDASASAAHFHFTGGNGNDTFIGGAGPDTFELQAGGDDTAIGGDGGDHFDLGAAFQASDVIDGGTGADRVEMTGGNPIVFGATTMTNVETIILDAGFSYSLTTNDATVAAGQNLLVSANTLGTGDTLVFKGSAETDGSFTIRGGAGNDAVTGGAGADTFNMIVGGDDVVKGGGGSDTITMGATLTAADQINGAGGTDAMTLSGDYSAGLTLGATTVVSVETISVGAGFNYNLTSNDGNVAAGATMAVDGSALGAANTLTFDGTAETDGSFVLIGGAGNDVLKGGAQADTFDISHGGSDTVRGGAGNDVVAVGTALDASDSIDGGTGSNTLTTTATGAITLSSANITNISTVDLLAGGANLTVTSDLTGANGTLTIDASATTTGVTVNTASIPGGRYNFTGGAGDDTIILGSNYTRNEIINGGGGNNTVTISDASNVVMTDTKDTHINKIVVSSLAYQPSIFSSFIGDITSGGGVLSIDTTALASNKSTTFNLSQATTAQVNFTGGSDSDQLVVGASQIKNGQINGTVDLGVDSPFVLNYLNFNGPFTGPITISDTNIHHVDIINIGDTINSSWTVTGDITGGDGRLQVSSGQSSGTSDRIDLTAMTTPAFLFTGNNGDDTVVIGSQIKTVTLYQGGNGTDTLDIKGGLTNYTFAAVNNNAGFSGLEKIVLEDGADYTGLAITGNIGADDNNRTNHAVTIDASALTGSHHASIDLSQASGSITFKGGAGDDTVILGDNASTLASFDGGAGNNTIELTGGTGGATLANVTNVNTVSFADGASYSNVTLTGSLNSTGAVNIDASALTGTNAVNIDVTGVTAPTINFTGGAGDDTITFSQDAGNMGTVNGGAGNNTINFHDASTATLSATSVTHINDVTFTDGFSYGLTVSGDITSGKGKLTIDASALTGTNAVNVDVSGATSPIIFTGSAGDDTINFGNALAHLSSVNGGAGNDTLKVAAASPFIAGDSVTSIENLDIGLVSGGQMTSVSIFGDITGGGGTLNIDTTAASAGQSANVFADNSTTSVINFTGGAGNDFLEYSTFNASDKFVGGSGNNSISFAAGQTGFAISADNFTNLNGITFNNAASGFSIVGDLTQGTATAGTFFVSTGSANVSVDFTATTTAKIDFTGGSGDDTVIFSGDKANWDRVNGGNGNNTFEIKDGAGTTLSGDNINYFSTVKFDDGFSYSNYAISGDITNGKGTLHVDASALTGTNSLSIDLSKATTTTLDFQGGAGDDTVTFGANISHAGTVDGGAGTNTLSLTGRGQEVDATFSGANFTHFSSLALTDGNAYDITVSSGFSTHDVTIDASALTNWGATVDVSGLSKTTVNFTGGDGDDTVIFGSNLGDAGTIDGGKGTNTLELNGHGTDVTASFSGAAFTHFGALTLEDGNNYDVTITAGFSGSDALTIDASGLTGTNGATVDASALIGTAVTFTGGQGDDAITVDSGALASDSIDGGSSGNDTLTVDNSGATSATISVTDSAVHNIDTLDLTGGAFTATLSGDLTSGSGTGTLTIDASGASSVDLDLSNDTETSFDVTGSAGDDTITISGFFSGTIDGGAGHNTLEISGPNTGGELNSANITGFDKVVYAADTAAGNGFVGDLTGNGGTLTVDASLADGTGGSGPDSDMATFSFDALTSGGLVFTGTAIDDYLSFSSKVWTSLDGNGGNYNAIAYTGTGAITFDDTTITGFNALAFGTNFNGDALTFSGIKVVGDLTGTDGTVAIDASQSKSISIDVSQATSSIAFTGGTGDDTITFGNTFSTSDSVAGGDGSDTLSLGRNTADLADTAVTGVETVTLSGSSGFAVTGDITSGGGTLTVDGSASTDDVHGNVNVDFSGATTHTINFTGGAAADRVTFSAASDNWGTVNGGGGSNNFLLANGGSATIDGASVTHFGDIVMKDGGSYALTLKGDITGDSSKLSVDGSQLTNSNNASVDASGSFDKIGFGGSAGDDTFTGSSHGDTINISAGGYDTVHGGSGDDSITANGVWITSDSIDGGAGVNTLTVTGSDVEFGGTNASNIETLITSGDVTLTGNISSATGSLTIDNSTATNFHEIDITGATTTVINVIAGAGDDYVRYNAFNSADHFTGGNGYNEVLLAPDEAGFTISSANFTALDELDIKGSTDQTFTVTGDVSQGGDNAGYFDIWAHDDTGNLTFDMTAATTASLEVEGGKGDDKIKLTTGQFNTTQLIGNGGNDTVTIQGNGTNFVSRTMTNATDQDIGKFILTGDNNFTMTFGAHMTQVANTLTVDASALTAGHSAHLDFGGATTGRINVIGGEANDTIVVKAGAIGTIDGGANDALDQNVLELHGGTGTITLTGYTGDDSVTPQISNIEKVVLDDGASYSLVIDGELAKTQGSFHLDASALTGSNTLTIDATQTGAGATYITGGAGDDVITIPTGPGLIDGGAGNDTVILASGGTLDASDFVSVENFSFSGDASSGYTVDVVGDLTGNGSSGTLSLDFQNVQNGGVTVDLTSATTGNFTITGSGGSDTVIITAGENLTGYQQLGGFDTLELTGGATSFTLDHATLGEGFCFLTFADGASYTGVTLIGDIANNTGALTVDASALTGANFVDVDLTQEINPIKAKGGAGDDTFTFSQMSLHNTSSLDGGAGSNTLGLNNLGSDFSFDIQDTAVQNIEKIVLADGNNYSFSVSGDITGGHGTLTVDAGAVSSAYSTYINFTPATTATLFVTTGAGDDTVIAGAANVTVDFSHGGNESFYGGSGTALIEMGATLTAADIIDGDATGHNTLSLDGDYSAGLTLSMLSNFNEIDLAGGHSYNLTSDDENAASSTQLIVFGANLGASDSLHFDGSAETDGYFLMYGGAGNDVLTGGAGNDNFNVEMGGNDTVHGGAGYDTIYVNAGWSAGDVFDGGADIDAVWFANKDYTGADAITFGANSLTSIENIFLGASHSYSLTMNDANVAAGQTMFIDGVAAKGFTFDGSAETDGHFLILDSASADVMTGGHLSDTFAFDAVSFTQGKNYDTITNVDFGSDSIWLGSGANLSTYYTPTGIATALTTGSLSTPVFVTDLTSDITSSVLPAHDAVLFTPNAGGLAGHTFLIVDANGIAGYQSTGDYVIDVTGYTGTLSLSSFASDSSSA